MQAPITNNFGQGTTVNQYGQQPAAPAPVAPVAATETDWGRILIIIFFGILAIILLSWLLKGCNGPMGFISTQAQPPVTVNCNPPCGCGHKHHTPRTREKVIVVEKTQPVEQLPAETVYVEPPVQQPVSYPSQQQAGVGFNAGLDFNIPVMNNRGQCVGYGNRRGDFSTSRCSYQTYQNQRQQRQPEQRQQRQQYQPQQHQQHQHQQYVNHGSGGNSYGGRGGVTPNPGGNHGGGGNSYGGRHGG